MINILDGFEHSSYNMDTGLKILESLHFTNDVCGIKKYIILRLAKNGLKDIVNPDLKRISPSLHISLGNCIPTSVYVGKKFSLS